MGQVRRTLGMAVAAALIVAGAAGCGNEGGDEDGASGTEATAATSADDTTVTTAATDAGGCPDETTLEVVNADAARGCDRVLVLAPQSASVRPARRPRRQLARLGSEVRSLLITPDATARRAIVRARSSDSA